ncbi:MAG: FHA domain-containing protein, partial [Myxococcales bacterium]|nr:FHA domain-containing protein [Myxococcales bacterium]
MIELVFQSGRQQGQTLSLTGSWITLGRAPQCEVVIDDPQASWEHCVVERVPAGFLVTDLGSSNGTFVNDHRLDAPEVLTPGDVLRLGNTRMVITFEATVPLLQADTEVGPAAPGDGALHLLVVAGPRAGASYKVEGEWATVGGEPGHTVHLPGVAGLVAYLVRGEDGYALQPAEEGRQDCLLDGAFVEHQALVAQDSILQLGGVSLQAAYGAPDEALTRELSTISQTPAAAAAPPGPGLDQTMRLSDADARRLVA